MTRFAKSGHIFKKGVYIKRGLPHTSDWTHSARHNLSCEYVKDLKIWQQYFEAYKNIVRKFEMASTYTTEVITHQNCYI